MSNSIYLGSTPISEQSAGPQGGFVEQESRTWYRITNFDRMPPFFMSITNPGDIWMFISSSGGITTGRTSKDSAVFPYTTVDKITESFPHTGSFCAMLVERDGRTSLWEPLVWGNPPVYDRTRSLQKSVFGDTIVFEEVNRSLGLEVRIAWEASPRYGVHRQVSLRNLEETPVTVRVLDGMRNIMPGGVSAQFQTALSNLLDAYKRSESDESGLGIFALSAALTDLAEPSESLICNTVWSYGLDGSDLALSDEGIGAFRSGQSVEDERDVRGRRGSYLRSATLALEGLQSRQWGYCAEVEQDHASVVQLRAELASDPEGLLSDLKADIASARDKMREILRANDGIQHVGSLSSQYHHVANVLFNLMRGGYFVNGYEVDTRAFAEFVNQWNIKVYNSHREMLEKLTPTIGHSELIEMCSSVGDLDLERLAHEFLPITFSRRHGDPSRPWNEFFIRTNDEDGNPIVGYQGNWRDIFQNWEALCLSYPMYLPSVVCKFLNATTADGYNPYRISQNGIDWEVPEPENPWSNIGYWGDHQIVYLARLMEQTGDYDQGSISRFLNQPSFVFADVPYRIKPIADLLADPTASIIFDHERDSQLREEVSARGADGKLLSDENGQPVHATMMEKLLILLLAKVANFVPGGGIWLNTQRPEWNDANNALAGWGLSVVTLSYLIRFIDLVGRMVANSSLEHFSLHAEVHEWLQRSSDQLHRMLPEAAQEPETRFEMLESLGDAASAYRESVYRNGLSATKSVSVQTIEAFLNRCRLHFAATLEATRLEDGSFESYQVLSIRRRTARVSRLYPMLEGQVAGVSSGTVDARDTLAVLDALRTGPLYRADQHSYMLYPNRELPGFLEKNTISATDAKKLSVLARPGHEWSEILNEDVAGSWHFDSSFRNARDLENSISHLNDDEKNELLALFENTFDHASFTGRSGTFYAFEGLGSIYWHMVSKLLLAVQEQLIEAVIAAEPAATVKALKDRYLDIRAGLGFNKDPATYGAFPADPYSHTPWGQGAKQPGMTGQVKEEVVARPAELGLIVRNGKIMFLPAIILNDQWRSQSNDFEFTFCGVKFHVSTGDSQMLEIALAEGERQTLTELAISEEISSEVFSRSGRVSSVGVIVRTTDLIQ